MRGKRAKQYRKLMKQYSLTFGFREPYQILGAFLTLHGSTGLANVNLTSVKPMITQCSIRHLYALPSTHPQKETLIAVAKAMERRRCNHHTLEEPLSTVECLSSVIDPKSTHTDKDLVNRFNYILAAQDEELRRWGRSVRGVPSIYVKRSVMVMEPMGERSQGIKEGTERGKFRAGLRGKEVLGKRKRDVQDAGEGAKDEDGVIGEGNQETKVDEEKPEEKKRKRGPKGPNPLSVRKARNKPEGKVTESVSHVDRSHEGNSVPQSTAEIGTGELQSSNRRKRKHKPKNAEASQSVRQPLEEDLN